jgi:hypothetical protein
VCSCPNGANSLLWAVILIHIISAIAINLSYAFVISTFPRDKFSLVNTYSFDVPFTYYSDHSIRFANSYDIPVAADYVSLIGRSRDLDRRPYIPYMENQIENLFIQAINSSCHAETCAIPVCLIEAILHPL